METKDLLKKAILGVIEQGEPSADKNGSCYYRKNKQKACKVRCAVGHLINDNNYTKSLEDQDATSSIVRNAVSNSIGRALNDDEIKYLEEIQDCHDYAARIEDVEFLVIFKKELTEAVGKKLLPEYCLEFIK